MTQLGTTITRLALFDIDGTLLTTNGRAVEAMMAAMVAIYGRRPENDGYLMDGKTELRIIHELLGAAGLERPAVSRRLPEFWSRYAQELQRRIHPARTTVYTGVRELIGRLRRREEVLLGLLTGNCPAAAEIKLRAAGLEGAFAFGAFGQEHEERSDLPGLALAEAERRFRTRLEGKAVAVLGDTPNDILCARPLGLRTIAVATGRYDVPSLAAHGPDFLFPDFADGAAVEQSILSDLHDSSPRSDPGRGEAAGPGPSRRGPP